MLTAAPSRDRYLRPEGLWWLVLTPPLLALLFDPRGGGAGNESVAGSLAAIWLYTVVTGALVHGSVNAVAARLRPGRARAVAVALTSVLAVLVGTAATLPVMRALCAGVAGQETGVLVRGLIVCGLYVGGWRVYTRLRTRADAEREAARAEKVAALEARWAALVARTNPHFLFNALNASAALVATDPELAERTLERISSLLRYSLDVGAHRFVPLGIELDIVRDYLAIEKARFGDRLAWQVRAPEPLHAVAIPPMLIQPLAENAVIHGIASRSSGGTIEVEVSADATCLQIVVRDNGGGAATAKRRGSGTGTGLASIAERLVLAYGDGAELSAGPAPDGGFAASIRITGRPC